MRIIFIRDRKGPPALVAYWYNADWQAFTGPFPALGCFQA